MTDLTTSLLYYARRKGESPWLPVLSETMAAIQDFIGPEQAERLLRGIGRRIAERLALGSCVALQDLEAGMNRGLEALDWGWARIQDAGRFLTVTHGAYPVSESGDRVDPWMIFVLEGLFSQWFESQGADPQFFAKCANRPNDVTIPLEFQFGRH